MPSRLLVWLRAAALVVVVLFMAAASSGVLQGPEPGSQNGRRNATAESALDLIPVQIASAQDEDDDEDR